MSDPFGSQKLRSQNNNKKQHFFLVIIGSENIVGLSVIKFISCLSMHFYWWIAITFLKLSIKYFSHLKNSKTNSDCPVTFHIKFKDKSHFRTLEQV